MSGNWKSIHRGYTLIEVLIVVTVLGLASALLTPLLGNRGDFDVQAAVRMLVADLTFAQSDALALQELRRVHFYEDGTGWCLVRIEESDLNSTFDASSADYISDPLAGSDRQLAYIVQLGNGNFGGARVESVELDGNSRDVSFDELGGTVSSTGLPGSGGSIVIAAPGVRYRIELAPVTGKIVVARIDGG
ncbi:MAG: type II secretion system protein [Phycisphaerales bacterium]|nr:type II secretion system protein [Phycisphaerales bacterium]